MDYDNTSAEENAKKQIQGAVGLRNVNLRKAYNEAEATKLKGKSEVASIPALKHLGFFITFLSDVKFAFFPVLKVNSIFSFFNALTLSSPIITTIKCHLLR
ncbi:MAG: hypothetical protein PUH01_05670 [Pseudomonadota bacterium]|nr:hypothetical protein [Pseudomonadota bacterium]